MHAFDTAPLFAHVAQDLTARFGADAVGLADQAVARFAAAQDQEALSMWRAVRQALGQTLALSGALPAGQMH